MFGYFSLCPVYYIMNLEEWKPNKVHAIEHWVSNPTATQTQVATAAGVNQATVSNWMKEPSFIEAFYDRYMVIYNSKLPSVLEAMIREALEGNVQAGRLVLEHSGKLQKNIVIKHESPFEKFLSSKKINDGEFTEIVKEVEPLLSDLPDRNKEANAVSRSREEVSKVRKIKKFADKNERRLNKRSDSYRLRARAKRVGLKPLGKGRPNRKEREAWVKELEMLEKRLNVSV